MAEKRYELYDKHSPNELIQDNYNIIGGYIQIYGAERVECELNDLFNRLRNINSICDDCLIIENSVSEINDMKWWENKDD